MNQDIDEVLDQTLLTLEMLGIGGFHPITSKSKRWDSWITIISPTTCVYCLEKNGRIVEKNTFSPKPPVHDNCRCFLKTLTAIRAGSATIDQARGADYWMKHYHSLPATYLTKEKAKAIGWRSVKGNLRNIIHNGNIGGDIFYNDKNKLPNTPSRIWYEADINYTGGYRNKHRLLYSNDGLLFVTYDHYKTFYEIN